MDNQGLLNAIQRRLDVLSQRFPDHPIIIKAIENVQNLLTDFSRDLCILLVDKLVSLQIERIWDGTGEDQELIEGLRFLNNNEHADVDLKIDLRDPNHKIPQVLRHDLPLEVMDRINETYLLHTVAMHPSRVLPPGKSILSVLSSRSRPESVPPTRLKEQVTNIMFKAFWDEALESLSAPSAAVQLARLRRLYLDLHQAVEKLVPPTLSIMHTLLNPLSPTSSPLRSASVHLKELLTVLRERCAPIRDAQFDELLIRLEVPYEELPQACIDVIKGILELADIMKEDMAEFIVGTWTEQDAVDWLKQQAINRERNVITEMFTLPKVIELHQTWISEVESATDEGRWVSRLMRALGSDQPVSPFPPSSNLLPPSLMYFAFDFLRTQNLLQALVISTGLRSLVHRYLKEDSNDWLNRIWSLLVAEIDMGSQNNLGDVTEQTRLINLEDEVVRVSGFKGEEGEPLRAAVRRTLRVEDPVYKLLQKRLLEGIQDRLLVQQPISKVPKTLRSGKANSLLAKEPEFAEEDLVVRGFEDPVLKKNIREVIISLRKCLNWFNGTWKGILT